MKGGYVLDFSNRAFQEFILSVLHVDIYSQYEYESKAKLLRKLFSDYSDTQVGKLLMELLRYRKTHLPIESNEKDDFNEALSIAYRLLGKNKSKKSNSTSEVKVTSDEYDFDHTSSLFSSLFSVQNPQRRGYEFEKVLFTLFKSNDLLPRPSFKIFGEQIDGSFEFENQIYLLEAKWTQRETNKSDLVIFNEKVHSKSGFTRGLFISYSGFGTNAVESFKYGRTIKTVLLTVQEIIISIERKILFRDVLKFKIRALAEEGNCFKNIIEM